MDTFLTRLAMRTLGLASGVQPLIAPAFSFSSLLGDNPRADWSASASLDRHEPDTAWRTSFAEESLSTVAPQVPRPSMPPPEPIAIPPATASPTISPTIAPTLSPSLPSRQINAATDIGAEADVDKPAGTRSPPSSLTTLFLSKSAAPESLSSSASSIQPMVTDSLQVIESQISPTSTPGSLLQRQIQQGNPTLQSRVDAKLGETIAPINNEGVNAVSTPEQSIPISADHRSRTETSIRPRETHSSGHSDSIEVAVELPIQPSLMPSPVHRLDSVETQQSPISPTLTNARTHSDPTPIVPTPATPGWSASIEVSPTPIVPTPAAPSFPALGKVSGASSPTIYPDASQFLETSDLSPRQIQPTTTIPSSVDSTIESTPISPPITVSATSLTSPTTSSSPTTSNLKTVASRPNPSDVSPHLAQAEVRLTQGETTAIQPRVEPGVSEAIVPSNHEGFSILSNSGSQLSDSGSQSSEQVVTANLTSPEPPLRTQLFTHTRTSSAPVPISPSASTIVSELAQPVTPASLPLHTNTNSSEIDADSSTPLRSTLQPQAQVSTFKSVSQRLLKQSSQQMRSTVDSSLKRDDRPTSVVTASATPVQPAAEVAAIQGESAEVGRRFSIAVAPKVEEPFSAIVPRLSETSPWQDSARPQSRISRTTQSPPATPPPTIQVKIGRIEVRRVTPPAPPPTRTQTKPTGPKLSLESYLQQRNGGAL